MTDINEKDIRHKVNIDVSMYDRNGIFTPQACQRMVMNMVEEHLDMLNIGENDLAERFGVSWVLLYTCFVPFAALRPGQKLTGVTWNVPYRRPTFRRDFRFFIDDGAPAAYGSMLTVLMDNGTRRLCLDKNIISDVSLPDEMADDLVSLKRRPTAELQRIETETRRIRPGMTDGIGHVNNARYAEMVYDAMTAEERSALSGMSRYDIWFISELHEGDEVRIYRCDDGKGTTFTGVKDLSDSFAMRIEFNGRM